MARQICRTAGLIGAFAGVLLTIAACGGSSPATVQSRASSTPTATPTSSATPTAASSGSAPGQGGKPGRRPAGPTSPPVSLLAEVLNAGAGILEVCVLPSGVTPPGKSCPAGSLSKKDGVRCTAVANFVRWRSSVASEARNQPPHTPLGPWNLAEQPSSAGGIEFVVDSNTLPQFPSDSTWRFDVTCTNGAVQAKASAEFSA